METETEKNSMGSKRPVGSVFTYTDYRKFLSDYLARRKEPGKKESLRIVCTRMGIKSAGHLSLILHGKTDISPDLARKIASFCRLRSRQLQYFLLLVEFNQAKTHNEKQNAFEKLVTFPRSCVYRMQPHQFRYYERWYHCVIRALTEFVPVKDEFDELARMVEPPIREYEARASIKLLAELNLIARDEQGLWRPTRTSIDTGSEAASQAINGFALSMLDKARESMDRIPASERQLSWVTVGIDREGYNEILDELRALRCRIAEIAQRRGADRVYQINLQAFPVSQPLQGLQP